MLGRLITSRTIDESKRRLYLFSYVLSSPYSNPDVDAALAELLGQETGPEAEALNSFIQEIDEAEVAMKEADDEDERQPSKADLKALHV